MDSTNEPSSSGSGRRGPASLLSTRRSRAASGSAEKRPGVGFSIGRVWNRLPASVTEPEDTKADCRLANLPYRFGWAR